MKLHEYHLNGCYFAWFIYLLIACSLFGKKFVVLCLKCFISKEILTDLVKSGKVPWIVYSQLNIMS